MGADSRKAPPLPAPTESDSNTGRETELDVGSRLTEKSTYSLPSDGSPITISTKKHKGLGLANNKSQTSLLIEYFEGGKEGKSESRRPSVRVKVTPSSKSRSRSASDHIQITERKGNRKPSYTKRIQLSPNVRSEVSAEGEGDDHSVHSYRSATEESNVTSRGGGPIEVDIMPRRHGSPLIPTTESSSRYVQQNASEISSMPADSFLDGKTRSPERKRSRSLSRGDIAAAGLATGLVAGAVADKLRTPSRRRSRSLSRERIVAQKAVEKVRGDKSERRRKHRSRSRSISGEHLTEGIKSPRRRSSRSHQDESLISAGDSSLLNSKISAKSGDQYSFRSGTSKSSINNPKLLETVEDAIRRLILPELTAIKRDQSKRDQRERHRRGSVTSGSGVSRDSVEEYTSTRGPSHHGSSTDLSARPKVTLNDGEVLSGNSFKVRKDKNHSIDRVKATDSPKSFDRETSEETIIQDGTARPRKKKSSDKNRGLEAAALGAGIGLTAAALQKHHSQEALDEKKERRRRRAKSHGRSESVAESYEEREHELVPPMPLMSEINASELTRSSILSAETDRPHSASQERAPIREVPRGIASPASITPTLTPVALQQGLGTQHSNFSRGNLSLHSEASPQQVHSQEYELDEHGRKVAFHNQKYDDSYIDEEHHSGHHTVAAGVAGAAAGAGIATMHHHHEDRDDSELLEEDDYGYEQNYQEVPPPLRYVPYGQDRRGLSPIQSVSGYTEGDPDNQRNSRLTRSTGSYSSLGKSAQHKQSPRSMRSLDSAGNVHSSHHDFTEVRQGGLTDSELTQDGEYWEEQHRENDRNRDIDGDSYRSSDPNAAYKHMTNYTDDSSSVQGVSAGQNIRGIGANPGYVHTPVAVESAVASLVNASELTGTSGPFDRRGSANSFEDGSERDFTSRGNSPTKRDTFGSSHAFLASPTKYADEYELDEHGRKVEMAKSKDSHILGKAALAGIAAGAAAQVLKGRNKKSSADQIRYEDVNEETGAPLHKSFKDRALQGQGKLPISPRQSFMSESVSHEHLEMGASGLPDAQHPMPEIGFGDGESDVYTNPSIIQGAVGGNQQIDQDRWSGHATPPRQRHEGPSVKSPRHDANLKAAEAALLGAAAGVGVSAAVAEHNRNVGGNKDDEWVRTSEERKRDTLITNPYEGTSPIAALGDHDLLGHGFEPSKLAYQAGSPGLPKDEGYISSAPNARSPGGTTPEQRIKGVNFQDHESGVGEDPFYTPKHNRHMSGMSHGMESPFYDSATGSGIDRIQSKDIVALMDHLTVRDAQRSARDTEILVTLVRAAAEMRNSFEDMKRLLADTEDVIITEVQTNTDKSIQKAINGPRPFPPPVARSVRQSSQDDVYEDIPAKRRNVFRRALKGLSMRSSNDLGKIEEMLVQLLGEVEGLKVAQGLKDGTHQGNSYDDLEPEGDYEHDHGYEPEGNAGTSTPSHASQSGHLSLPISRGVANGSRAGFDGRKFSDHRISTVPEGDEEDLEHHEQKVLDNQFENNEQLLTPTRENFRGSSAPLGTPPPQVAPASLSNENTPRTATDKSKKHKSSSSSGWIPKVSRWSETTASTVLRGFRSSGRNSGRKEDLFPDPPSRSGSDLGEYPEHDPYGDDRLQYSPERHQAQQQEDEEEEAPLAPEDPKYKAHRNSLLLEHPQPRPGPTHRYQTALESKAHNYDAPMSPSTLNWSQTSLNRLPVPRTNRYSDGTNHTGHMSPGSDGAYSHGSDVNQAPARPPKEPLVPQIPPKIRANKLQKPSPLKNERLSVGDDTYVSPGGAEYEQGGSPRSATRTMSGALGGVPMRKPTGPRNMSSTTRGEDLNRDEGTVRRNNRNTSFGAAASNHSGESETF